MVIKSEHRMTLAIYNLNPKIEKNNFCDTISRVHRERWKNIVTYFVKFDKPGFTFPFYHLLGMRLRAES